MDSPPALIAQWASKDELVDLQMLTKQSGWGILLRYLKKLELEAMRDLQAFKTPEEALERKGFANGVAKAVNFISPLGGTISAGRHTSDIGDPTEYESPADRPATDFSY